MTRVKYELSVKFYPYDHEMLGAREYLNGSSYIQFYHKGEWKRCYSFNFSGIYSVGLCNTKREAKQLIKDFKDICGLDWKNDRFTIRPITFELF